MTSDWDIPVHDYQSSNLYSVLPSTPLRWVQHALEEHDISAVPVVDEEGALRGIVSSADLLRAATLPPPKLRDARDIMQTDVVTVDTNATIREAAGKMGERRIHRVVVLRDARPIGVLSSRDLMKAVFENRVPAPLSTVMTKHVETIEIGESIDTAVSRLTTANVRGLVVVDEGWPVGVFTHTEAIKGRALPPELRQTPVEQVMSYETICLDSSTPLYRVAGYATQMHVRRILAVEHRRLVGIVTGFDIVRYMTDP